MDKLIDEDEYPSVCLVCISEIEEDGKLIRCTGCRSSYCTSCVAIADYTFKTDRKTVSQCHECMSPSPKFWMPIECAN